MLYKVRKDTHKNLDLLAESKGCKVIKIGYKFQGISLKRKGFDVVDGWNSILISIEPIHYTNGDRWLVNNYCTGKQIYLKNLAYIKNQIITPGMQTGYKLSKSASYRWDVIKEPIV